MTFREMIPVYKDFLLSFGNKYELICISMSDEKYENVQTINCTTEGGVAAIVRALKPKIHIDNHTYENLHNFVKIISWENLDRIV